MINTSIFIQILFCAVLCDRRSEVNDIGSFVLNASLYTLREDSCGADTFCTKQLANKAACHLVQYDTEKDVTPSSQKGLLYCRCQPAWIENNCSKGSTLCYPEVCDKHEVCHEDRKTETGFRCLPLLTRKRRYAKDHSTLYHQRARKIRRSKRYSKKKLNVKPTETDSIKDTKKKETTKTPKKKIVVKDACAVKPCGPAWKCRSKHISKAGFTCGCQSRPGYKARSAEDPTCVIHNYCEAFKPCRHAGNCRSAQGKKKFTCSCTPAWSGKTCSSPKNPCKKSDNPCGVGWKCRRAVDHPSGFSCNCKDKPGWLATSERNPICKLADACLAKKPCLNGGTCTTADGEKREGNEGFKCQCPPVWTGSRCEKTKNPCAAGANLCGVGWSCRRDEESLVGFNCSCHLRFGWKSRSPTDPVCVKDDRCDTTSTCKNGGVCSTIDQFRCNCTAAWKGPTCETPRDPCLHGPICGVQGNCQRDPRSEPGFTCNCQEFPGYKSKSDSSPKCVVYDICKATTVCKNAGTCVSKGSGKSKFKCLCPAAWTGKRCERPNNPCLVDSGSGPCGKGWACTRSPTTPPGYECDCSSRPGWKPTSDTDPTCDVHDTCLAKNPCLHGGTCYSIVDPHGRPAHECRCMPAWSGHNCGQPREPCSELHQPCNPSFTCQRDVDSAHGYDCGCESKAGYRAVSLSNPQCVLFDACLAKQPCNNGGTCIPVGDSQYYCECSRSWTGRHCESIRPSCTGLQHQCESGWPCERSSNSTLGYTCGCEYRPGWAANDEDGKCHMVDACLARWPCQNEGTCLNGAGGGFKCQCPSGWKGDICGEPDDPCAKDDQLCGAEFHCSQDSVGGAGYSCNCHQRTGWRAASVLDPSCVVYDRCLADSPCLNGGKCILQGDKNFTCSCPKSATGDICQHAEETTPGAITNVAVLPTAVAKKHEEAVEFMNDDEEDDLDTISEVDGKVHRHMEVSHSASEGELEREIANLTPSRVHILLFVLLLALVVLLVILACICVWRLCIRRKAEKRDYKYRRQKLAMLAQELYDREKQQKSSGGDQQLLEDSNLMAVSGQMDGYSRPEMRASRSRTSTADQLQVDPSANYNDQQYYPGTEYYNDAAADGWDQRPKDLSRRGSYSLQLKSETLPYDDAGRSSAVASAPTVNSYASSDSYSQDSTGYARPVASEKLHQYSSYS